MDSKALEAKAKSLGVADPPPYVREIVIPIAQEIENRKSSQFFLVTIIGGPGSGKTTLAALLQSALEASDHHCLTISSDDFYRTKAERQERGIKWRGLPGSVDSALCKQVIDTLVNRAPQIDVPCFDMTRDDRGESKTIEGPIDVCLFEGWMVQPLLTEAYGNSPPCNQLSVYIDAPMEELKNGRFRREEILKEQHGAKAGFTKEELSAFWEESLKPGTERYVLPYRDSADIRIKNGTVSFRHE